MLLLLLLQSFWGWRRFQISFLDGKLDFLMILFLVEAKSLFVHLYVCFCQKSSLWKILKYIWQYLIHKADAGGWQHPMTIITRVNLNKAVERVCFFSLMWKVVTFVSICRFKLLYFTLLMFQCWSSWFHLKLLYIHTLLTGLSDVKQKTTTAAQCPSRWTTEHQWHHIPTPACSRFTSRHVIMFSLEGCCVRCGDKVHWSVPQQRADGLLSVLKVLSDGRVPPSGFICQWKQNKTKQKQPVFP